MVLNHTVYQHLWGLTFPRCYSINPRGPNGNSYNSWSFFDFLNVWGLDFFLKDKISLRYLVFIQLLTLSRIFILLLLLLGFAFFFNFFVDLFSDFFDFLFDFLFVFFITYWVSKRNWVRIKWCLVCHSLKWSRLLSNAILRYGKIFFYNWTERIWFLSQNLSFLLQHRRLCWLLLRF